MLRVLLQDAQSPQQCDQLTIVDFCKLLIEAQAFDASELICSWLFLLNLINCECFSNRYTSH